jgi:hypothetical protein
MNRNTQRRTGTAGVLCRTKIGMGTGWRRVMWGELNEACNEALFALRILGCVLGCVVFFVQPHVL